MTRTCRNTTYTQQSRSRLAISNTKTANQALSAFLKGPSTNNFLPAEGIKPQILLSQADSLAFQTTAGPKLFDFSHFTISPTGLDSTWLLGTLDTTRDHYTLFLVTPNLTRTI